MLKKFLCLTLFSALGAARVAAVDITFASPAFEVGKTSSGGLLTGSFTFALGSFGTFTPTALNTTQWAANFTAVGTTAWDETFTQFNDLKTLPSNSSPFQTTAQAYIWGYDLTSGAAQWVLITNASWTFPVASNLLPVQWTTSDAGTLAILGSLGAALVGADPYIQASAVNTSAVPEPAAVAVLLGLAALGVTTYRRRTQRHASASARLTVD